MLSRVVQGTIRRVKQAGTSVSGQLGMYHKSFSQASGERMIVYHGICKKDHTRFNPIFLTAAQFEEQLQFYTKYFQCVSLEEFMEGKRTSNRFRIALSFDDGFANNRQYVLPLLKKYQVPATFFITTAGATGQEILWNDFLNMFTKYGPAQVEWQGKVYKRNRFRRYVDSAGIALANELREQSFAVKKVMMETFSKQFDYKKQSSDQVYWQLMNEQDIRELAACPLVTIGAHGLYHNDLAHLEYNEILADLRESRQWLESVTGKPVYAYAFPYGSYTTNVVKQAQNLGYKYLLAADELVTGDTESNQLRRRMTINPFINTYQQMHAIIRGSY